METLKASGIEFTCLSSREVNSINYEKLVDNFLENDIDELYDLINDPGEMNNLINDEDYDEIEKELRSESKRLQKKYKYNPDRDWWLKTQIKKQ